MEDIRVKDVMVKKIKIVKDTDTIKKAANMMKKNRIGSVVVLGKNKRVVGIVTKTDIVYKYVANDKKTIKKIMTEKPKSISPDKTIEDAATLMTKNKIEKLLVFDKDKFVGIISVTDILRVQPGLFTILFEGLKKEGPVMKQETTFGTCESCGNYSDDLRDVDGIWICPECRDVEK